MKKFLTYTLLGVLLAGCAGSGREPLETVVDKALAGAERQTLLMAEKYSAREGRLPRTWENGEDVSSDSRWWCSGFFPGVLWYVYENGRNPPGAGVRPDVHRTRRAGKTHHRQP